MIAFYPDASNPSADRVDAFITTGLGLLIGSLAAAGTTAATSIYGANKAADTATQAGELQNKTAEEQLAFQKQQAATDQANYERTMQFNLAQYNAKRAALQPYVNLGTGAATTLANMIGGPVAGGMGTPAPVATLPPLASTATTPTSSQPPITPSSTVPNATTTVAGGTGVSPQTPQAFGDLSDPASWMSLVGNDTKLAQWVKSQAPGLSDGLVNYYVGKIKGQPGANASEQAGSANYWAQKIKADPTLAGGSGTTGTRSPMAPMTDYTGGLNPTTLNSLMTPAMMTPQDPTVPQIPMAAGPATLNNFIRPVQRMPLG